MSENKSSNPNHRLAGRFSSFAWQKLIVEYNLKQYHGVELERAVNMIVEKCLLLADDNESMFFILKKACEKNGAGHPVRWVKSGDQLLQYLRREVPYAASEQFPLPGVILMDIRMPGMSTQEVLDDIRSNEALKHIPVILWSNYAREEILDVDLNHVDDYQTGRFS